MRPTFDKFAAVYLAGGDFKGYDMILMESYKHLPLFLRLSAPVGGKTYLGFVEELDGYTNSARHDGYVENWFALRERSMYLIGLKAR